MTDVDAPAPSFLRRRILGPIIAQLTQGATPDRIALSLGLGLALGLFPFLGFTTLLCFVVAAALRLNQPIIHIINQLLWPIWIPMVAVYIKVGATIYGSAAMPFDPVKVGVHAFTAWAISVPMITGVTYYASRPAIRRLADALARRA